MQSADLIAEALAPRKDAIVYTISRLLAEKYPDKYVLETESGYFDVVSFAFEGQCEIKAREGVHNQWSDDWDAGEHKQTSDPYNAWIDVTWQGHNIEVVVIGYLGSHCRSEWNCIVAENMEVADAFFQAVCEWNSEVRGEVLVYSGEGWYKSKDLFEDIQVASFDDLVLEHGLKEEIVGDLRSFFDARERYERYGIAWKRGVLFLGPPGNGKTHAVKAAINMLQQPCLYVKSFSAQYSTDHDNMSRVFRRAREVAPCVLVFEDLDSLLTNENRAYFLNEMDGFASNSGILTVATTNHPERLDPAILERPSRFDRKYTFDLPGPEGRGTYMRLFSQRLDAELQPSPEAIERLAEQTDGYSYAYLKELFLSAMMQWIENPGKQTMDELMSAQCDTLRQQMASEPETETLDDDGEDGPPMPPFARQMMKRYRRAMRM